MLSEIQHIKLLMIDDDEDDILLMEDMLEGLKKGKQSYTLHAYTSLDKAVEDLEEHQIYASLKDHYIQIALLDLNLGPTHGIQTLRAFKRRLGNLPVIVLTGMSGEEIGRTCIQEGASDYLVKDRYSPEQFMRSVNYAIDRHALSEKINSQKQQIEQSYSQLEELLFAASHDLKEPLQGIVRFTQLVQKKHQEQLDEGDKDALAFIVGEGKRQHAQIDGLMRYLEVNQKKNLVETIYLNPLIKDLVIKIKAKHQIDKWEINFPPLPNILFNKDLAEILFEALLDNAVKFRKRNEEGVVVDIDLEERDTHWFFMIKDNGIGISTEVKPKIWSLFKQGLLKHDLKGIGLGLSLAQKIIHSFGGEIGIDSELGLGTTVHFTIPKNTEKRTIKVLRSKY